MSWLSTSALSPALPAHCEPTTEFLFHFSSTFHTCVPTPLAFASQALGSCSIVAWLFAQLPQIYKNYSISSTSGLSIFFLVEWCLGDLGNLFGALFTHQASWQVAIGGYYVFVDLCLVGQWLWYERLRHGSTVRGVVSQYGAEDGDGHGGDMEQRVIEGVQVGGGASPKGSLSDPYAGQKSAKQPATPRVIFRTPTFERDRAEAGNVEVPATPNGTIVRRAGPAFPLPSPSPRTILLIACMMAMAQASPISRHTHATLHLNATSAEPTHLETIGTVLSWVSTVLYLGSRLPQLFKNWRRKSTAGLSPHLFAAAFCGNLLYSSAMVTNPNVWYDFEPYGGNGWAGRDGSERARWIAAALPFFLGAAGVLGLDASVGIQFLLYGERDARIVVVEDTGTRKWHWRRVSGWMRGWIPSVSEAKDGEREVLLERNDSHSEGYGTP